MDNKEINRLLEAYENNSITPREKVELYRLLSDSSNLIIIKEWIENRWKNEELPELLTNGESQSLFDSIKESVNQSAPISYRHSFLRIAAAAAIIIFMLGGSYLWYSTQNRTDKQEQIALAYSSQDIKAPTTNHATITLSDGKILYLDNIENGNLSKQEGVEIVKLDDGQIQYQGNTKTDLTNTLSNPKGSKVVSITLADSTIIILNAGSSIIYPLSFTGEERKVSLKGEAYFEVAHNKNMPFIVSVENKATVKVLGTRFNVKAYEDDSYTSITLVDGSVDVAKEFAGVNSKYNRLIPGEQAIFDSNGLLSVRKIDPDEFTAWKDNMFYFNDAELESIMSSLARWYNLDVVYEDKGLKSLTFGALISRQSDISAILNLMEMTGTIDFSILDKKIIIKKQKNRK